MTDPTIRELHAAVKPYWRKILIVTIIGVLLITTVGQLLYSTDRLVPFTSVSGLDLGGLSKIDAISKLDSAYANKTISIYYGDSKKAYSSPKLPEIGIITSNKDRISQVDYPWYLRIIPSSILWAHFVINPGTEPVYNRNEAILNAYIDKELGTSCDVKPQDAGLKLSGTVFEVVPSHSGGVCDINIVKQMLSDVKPDLGDNRVTIPFTENKVDISDEAAQQLADKLENNAGNGVVLVLSDTLSQTIPTSELFGWIDFSFSGGQLTYTLNEERASGYLIKEVASKVAETAGTTVINTYDFVEVSRVEGTVGQKLDIAATLNNLKLFLDGESTQAIMAATTVALPRITYNRSYSSTDTGLSAFMQQYSQTHDGVYGVSLIELTGKHRRASYDETKIFTPASTYKLFVAYSSLLKVESGAWHMTDPIVDIRNLDECFDDMLVQSRNTCAEALIIKLGREQITNDAVAQGFTQTSFMKNGELETSPADLALYMAQLATGQILGLQSSRDKIIDSLKRSTYRSGIPAGIPGSTVINKIGVLWGILNDTAIVYSPTGTYILTIMTDGSNWSTIADFAGKTEALRNQ